ncbi:MAG TPA: hypothetical protein VJ954_01575 [Ignavibacteriaceae bacterium]|nr:hypothetical protein [Ignavibacteriaceae bacterium]
MFEFHLFNIESRPVLHKTILLLILLTTFLVAQEKSDHTHHTMNDSTLMHRQHMIHSKSPMVMPFDMSKVTHYFIKTEGGGVLEIKVKDPVDKTQISLIRKHLGKERILFSKADFRDPKTLHGKNMPGLKTLSEYAGKYKVEYEELPLGARLTFNSKNPTVINALHNWFDAQLKDHGKDAKKHLDKK